MNVLLLLGTVIGSAGLTLAALLSLALGARLRAALLGGGALAWVALYGAGVIVISLASHETVLPAGETKRFCGFYFDCHLGVAVRQDVVAPVIAGRAASGTWHVVTLEFSSDARRETLTPYDLQILIVDAHGTRYRRDLAAESNLPGGRPEGIARPIAAGDSYTVPVVFDLPRDIDTPRLLVAEGLGVDRVIEGVLIGDEDSYLHRKTLLALPGRLDISVR